MQKYIMNANTCEVHKKHDCDHLPNDVNKIDLGIHTNCSFAVMDAKNKGYSKANTCGHCCE